MQQNNYFKGLTIIHFAMLIGQLAFAGVAYFLVQNGLFTIGSSNLNDAFLIMVPIFMVGSLMSVRVITKLGLQTIKQQNNLHEKLNKYRTTLIIKFALLETPSFLAIIAFMITYNFLFLAMLGFMIAVFLMNRPTREKTAEELELDQKERMGLEAML